MEDNIWKLLSEKWAHKISQEELESDARIKKSMADIVPDASDDDDYDMDDIDW